MNKKSEDLETLGVLSGDIQDVDLQNETDEELQVAKTPKKRIYNVKPKDPNAPKKERTPAQIDAWNKALATRQANRDSRMTEKQKVAQDLKKKADMAKKAVEEKIVKKAISIKKKQIKKEILLDEVSDDETPVEEIKKIVKDKRQQPPRTVKVVNIVEPPKPQFYFM
jgi:hypothetical protein